MWPQGYYNKIKIYWKQVWSKILETEQFPFGRQWFLCGNKKKIHEVVEGGEKLKMSRAICYGKTKPQYARNEIQNMEYQLEILNEAIEKN